MNLHLWSLRCDRSIELFCNIFCQSPGKIISALLENDTGIESSFCSVLRASSFNAFRAQDIS